MTNREIHLLSGAYALGAVDAEEARLVEAAMAESEELRHEVVGLSDTAVALGLAVPAQTPPPALRSRLLDLIEVLPQEPAKPEAAPEARPDVARAAHVAPRRRRRMRRLPAVLLSGAVAAILLFTGGALVQRTLLAPQSDFARIQAAADSRHSTMRMADGGIATVSWSRTIGKTSVVLNGVTVPSGKVLQLWSVRGKNAVTSEGLYEPQGDESYEIVSGVPVSGEQLAVSIEPAGGSKHPTTVPIVMVPLEA